MALRSPLEDFEATTLQAIPGLLAKLHYIAGLHDGEGNYSHWGMGRTHAQDLLTSLIQRVPQALLERAGAPSQKHLRAVLHALSALMESRASATHPDASRLPPPVQ